MGYTAITLARSGSKGLPGKNLLPISGIAVSHFPLMAANSSSSITRFIYSSDSETYLDQVTDTFSALEKPNLDFHAHKRSEYNSSDSASSWDAVSEIVEEFDLSKSEEGVILISATCPTISCIDIERFCHAISGKQTAMSVREVDYPIENTFHSKSNLYKPHDMTSFLSARQERTRTYRPDGHLYFRSLSSFSDRFPNEQTVLVDLKKSFYANIDTKQDYEIARYFLERS